VDVFDYGYKNLDECIDAHSSYHGQITAPVNFGMLEHAAKYLGFETLLEKDSEYIKRNLGMDSIRISYAKRIFNNETTGDARSQELILGVLYSWFAKHVRGICPDAEWKDEEIVMMRAERSFFNHCLIDTLVGKEILMNQTGIQEGTYHLSIDK